jgi:D-alanine transaminase
MSRQTVYLNGEFLPLEDAKIPVLDRGFIFGDSVYDVLTVYGGKMFRAQEHLARLARSLAAIGIDNPHGADEWLAIVGRLIASHPDPDQILYIQVTRGVAPRAHAFPAGIAPTVFMMANPLPALPREMRERGVSCVTMEDQRWLHCDIKSVSLLGNVLAAQNAASHGVTEAIQFRDGFLTEASSSNVWIVKDGELLGSRKNNLVLEGIRYGLYEELCRANGIPFTLRDITRDEVFAADEVVLSSTVKEVLPVVSLDGKPVGDGRPGPLAARLYALYQDAKARSR